MLPVTSTAPRSAPLALRRSLLPLGLLVALPLLLLVLLLQAPPAAASAQCSRVVVPCACKPGQVETVVLD